MELGYNTDITLENGTYHVQTEGRLDKNPRVDTLVYKDGVVLGRVSNSDGDLGLEDRRIEETKRKIRDQHLTVVAHVRRNEFERIAAVRPSQSAYDFLDLVPSDVAADWREVLQGRHETVFEEWKKGLADAAGMITPAERYKEFRRILDAFGRFLADDSIPINEKQGLLSYLLRLDVRFRAIDFYEAFRRERGDVEEYARLIASLKAGTNRLVDLLIRQSSDESALATELLLDLFTRQSMEIVKYLFEEAERRLNDERGEAHEVLPTVLLYLEEKVSSENIPSRDLDDIFDRLSYLYARLSVKTVRDISSRIAKIRDERGVRPRLRSEQKKKVVEYIDFLETCKDQIEKTWNLEEKLVKINEFKTTIDGWDKVLRLYINMRLALKGYHNFVTVNILETAELVSMKLRKLVPTLGKGQREGAEAILAELQGSLDAQMNVRKVIVPAIKAQQLLEKLEAMRLEAQVTQEETLLEEVGPGALGEEAPSAEVLPAAPAPPATAEAPAPAPPPPEGPAARVKAIEDRIKVGALALLKNIEELTRATSDLGKLERDPALEAGLRARLMTCRRELQIKKKVLQHRLGALLAAP